MLKLDLNVALELFAVQLKSNQRIGKEHFDQLSKLLLFAGELKWRQKYRRRFLNQPNQPTIVKGAKSLKVLLILTFKTYNAAKLFCICYF